VAENQHFRSAGRLAVSMYIKFGVCDTHVGRSVSQCETSPQSVHVGGYATPKYQQFSLFGKDLPHSGKPLDRFLNVLGAFMRPTTLCRFFKFGMIRFTDYRVIAEKPRVSHLPRIFPAPCRKNCFGSKMSYIFFNALESSITKQVSGRSNNARCTLQVRMVCRFLCGPPP